MKRFLALSLLLPLLFTAAVFAEQAGTEPETDTEVVTDTETETEEPYPAAVIIEGPDESDGDEFIVSVTADGQNLRGGGAKLTFDGSKAEVFSVEYPEETDITVRYTVGDGYMTFVFYNTEAVTGAVKVMDVIFKIKDGEANDSITVKAEDPVLSDGTAEVTPVTEEYVCTLSESIHTETETETEEVTETQTETETETETQTETKTEKQTETEPATQTEKVTEPVTETETETEKITETETETEPVTQTETETETVTETQTKTTAVTEKETEKQTVTEKQTEPATETAPVSGGDGRFSNIIFVFVVSAACTALSAGCWLLYDKIKKRK